MNGFPANEHFKAKVPEFVDPNPLPRLMKAITGAIKKADLWPDAEVHWALTWTSQPTDSPVPAVCFVTDKGDDIDGFRTFIEQFPWISDPSKVGDHGE